MVWLLQVIIQGVVSWRKKWTTDAQVTGHPLLGAVEARGRPAVEMRHPGRSPSSGLCMSGRPGVVGTSHGQAGTDHQGLRVLSSSSGSIRKVRGQVLAQKGPSQKLAYENTEEKAPELVPRPAPTCF